MVIFKAHHSLCDGISSMYIGLQLDEEFDPTKLISFPKVPFWLKWFFRLSAPFMIPIIMVKEGLRKVDRNILHDGKRNLTG